MDFTLLPPEVNSARMYAGFGSAPLMDAAASWNATAAQLAEAAARVSSTVTALAGVWIGPSAAAMSAAVGTYSTWLATTATHAETTATAATAAADAFEAAFAATVPPAEIAANRALCAFLVATNFLGVNTAAIMANEAVYAEFWAQDVAAMTAYQANSAAATSGLPQWTAAPQVAKTANLANTATSATAGTAQSVLSNLWADWINPSTLLGQLNVYSQAFVSSGAAESTVPQILQLFTVLWAVSQSSNAYSQAITNRFPLDITPAIEPEIAAAAQAAEAPAISAEIGAADQIRQLSVPPSWASPQTPSAPAVRPLPNTNTTNTNGYPLPLPLPVGRGGGSEKRPTPQYGVTPTVMPRHPFGG